MVPRSTESWKMRDTDLVPGKEYSFWDLRRMFEQLCEDTEDDETADLLGDFDDTIFICTDRVIHAHKMDLVVLDVRRD